MQTRYAFILRWSDYSGFILYTQLSPMPTVQMNYDHSRSDHMNYTLLWRFSGHIARTLVLPYRPVANSSRKVSDEKALFVPQGAMLAQFRPTRHDQSEVAAESVVNCGREVFVGGPWQPTLLVKQVNDSSAPLLYQVCKHGEQRDGTLQMCIMPCCHGYQCSPGCP